MPNHPGKRPFSLNTASANTGEGCPVISGTRAPDTTLPDLLAGNLILSREFNFEPEKFFRAPTAHCPACDGSKTTEN